jgi:hypothetical protein
VKSSFTISKILIDKTALQDLILGDKGNNIGHAHTGLHKTIRNLFKEDPHNETIFDIEWLETRMKKYMHFLNDCVSVSVVLAEECQLKPRAHKPKREWREEDEEPAVSLPSYEIKVVLNSG